MNTNKKSYFKFLIHVLVFSVLTSGCSDHPISNGITQSATISPTTPTSFEPSTETKETVTITPSPSHAPTIEATMTPLAKLPPDDALSAVEKIAANNGGCSLPCFWGIVPGTTTWEEFNKVFSPLSKICQSSTLGKTITNQICFPYFESDQPTPSYSFLLDIKNGIVVGINTNISYADRDFDYTLANILKTFGEPSEVWIRPIAESQDDQPYYDLRLFYQSKGMVIWLDGNAQKRNDLLQICPQIMFTRTPPPAPIFLFDSSEKIGFQEIETKLLGRSLGWQSDQYLLLDEVTDGFTSKDFFETYVESGVSTCFDVHPVPLRS